jgi:hypothetical protein
MTYEERKKEWHKVYQEFQTQKEKELRQLKIKFAHDTHNKIGIGDIVEDHIGKIKVERIGTYTNIFGIPFCYYEGKELKKNGEPKKSGAVRTVHEENLR